MNYRFSSKIFLRENVLECNLGTGSRKEAFKTKVCLIFRELEREHERSYLSRNIYSFAYIRDLIIVVLCDKKITPVVCNVTELFIINCCESMHIIYAKRTALTYYFTGACDLGELVALYDLFVDLFQPNKKYFENIFTFFHM